MHVIKEDAATPVDKISRLLSVIETVKLHGTPGDPEAAEWFLSGFNEYMTTREYRTLDKVFGLTAGRGTPSQRTQFMKSKRNGYLIAAFENTDSEKPDSIRCGDLLTQIEKMEGRIYRIWKSQGGPPETCSPLQENLFHAKETGQPFPTTWRSLARIVLDY